MLGSSDLIIHPDGSIFHLHLKPGQLAKDILLFGDPKRIDLILPFLEDIEHQTQNREYRSVTGKYKGKRVSAVSTGVGLSNMDIVLNELDAVFNMDFETKTPKENPTSLNLIRIGTSGGLLEDVPVDSWLITQHSIGLDNLFAFHGGSTHAEEKNLTNAIHEHFTHEIYRSIYAVPASKALIDQLDSEQTRLGITLSAHGFYSAQGRNLRMAPADPHFFDKIDSFSFENQRITNFEMESAPLYGYSKLLGHQALCVCLIIANRVTQATDLDYQPKMKSLIEYVLDRI